MSEKHEKFRNDQGADAEARRPDLEPASDDVEGMAEETGSTHIADAADPVDQGAEEETLNADPSSDNPDEDVAVSPTPSVDETAPLKEDGNAEDPEPRAEDEQVSATDDDADINEGSEESSNPVTDTEADDDEHFPVSEETETGGEGEVDTDGPSQEEEQQSETDEESEASVQETEGITEESVEAEANDEETEDVKLNEDSESEDEVVASDESGEQLAADSDANVDPVAEESEPVSVDEQPELVDDSNTESDEADSVQEDAVTEKDDPEPEADIETVADPSDEETPAEESGSGSDEETEDVSDTKGKGPAEPAQEFEDLDLDRLLPMLEALLFAAEEPLNAKEINESIPEVISKNVPQLIQALDDWYADQHRALTVQRVAGGWRLATRPEFADVIRRHLRGKIKGRLSRASLETISIIAYRQPVSRPEVDQMRGVDSGPVIRNLLERDLIKVTGRAEAPGRPILYSTTEKFLEYFGLESLGSLPKPEEILGDLEGAEAGTKVKLRSGPFQGAGEGVEEETYRTADMVHRDQQSETEPDEEEAPVFQQEVDSGGSTEPEPDEEEAPSIPPEAVDEKEGQE